MHKADKVTGAMVLKDPGMEATANGITGNKVGTDWMDFRKTIR
jgi:hypothetical protein